GRQRLRRLRGTRDRQRGARHRAGRAARSADHLHGRWWPVLAGPPPQRAHRCRPRWCRPRRCGTRGRRHRDGGVGTAVGAGHDTHLMYRPGDSRVHRLPPEVKIAATVGFTVAVVSTPREAFWAFGVYAALVALVAAVARIPPGWLARRATIEVPFVALAFALPFLGAGERVSFAGLSLSVDGLLGGWNIIAKATLGLLASLVLVGTTTVRDLILGLDRLRCPSAITQIATFMLRYLDVLAAEARRMRVARIARGDDPRFLWQVRGFAVTVG